MKNTFLLILLVTSYSLSAQSNSELKQHFENYYSLCLEFAFGYCFPYCRNYGNQTSVPLVNHELASYRTAVTGSSSSVLELELVVILEQMGIPIFLHLGRCSRVG